MRLQSSPLSILLLLLPALVESQSSAASSALPAPSTLVSQLPVCGYNCLASAAALANCSVTDYACICGSGRQTVVKAATPCVASSCSTMDILTTQNIAKEICKQVVVNNGSSSINSLSSSAVLSPSSQSSTTPTQSSRSSSSSSTPPSSTSTSSSSSSSSSSSTSTNSSPTSTPSPKVSSGDGLNLARELGTLGAVLGAAALGVLL